MKRIGIAITAPRGPNNHRNEYGIWTFPEFPTSRYTRFEGHSEDSLDGRILVGLPLAGPMAYYQQPMTPLVEAHFETVRFFEEKQCS